MDSFKDCQIIHNSIHGREINEEKLVDILGKTTNEHIQKVREEYERLYLVDMIKDVEPKLSFHFRKLVLGLMKSKTEFRADEIYFQSKSKIREDMIIDLIVTQDNKSLVELKQFFRQKYEMGLVDLFINEPNDSFTKAMLCILEANRCNSCMLDKLGSDVEELDKICQLKDQNKEIGLMEIISKRSHLHLTKLKEEYEKRYSRKLKDCIYQSTNGKFRDLLLACIDKPEEHWAKRLRMNSNNNLDVELLVVCFAQSEKYFIQKIKEEYEKMFGSSLEDDIKKETSGNVQLLLLTLISFPEWEKEDYNTKMNYLNF